MTLSQFASLLRYNLSGLWGCLGISLWIAWLDAITLGMEPSNDHIFFISSWESMILLLNANQCINTLFRNKNYAASRTGHSANNPEFILSRAIDKTSLYGLKTSLYLLIGLMPLLAVWGSSYISPVIRVETGQNHEITKQFYLAHFEGAYMEGPLIDTSKQVKEAKFYVIMPNGNVDRAVFNFILILTGLLLYQFIIFCFPPGMRWVSNFIFLALIPMISFGNSVLKIPSHYEIGLAWVTHHVFGSSWV